MVPHSLTDSAPKQYNLRVVESLIAARLLLHAWGLSDSRPAGRIWLKEVLFLRYGQEVPSYETLLSQVEEILGSDGKGDRGWTREEMIDKSGLSSTEFTRLYLDFLQGKSPARAVADMQSGPTASISCDERVTSWANQKGSSSFVNYRETTHP